MFTCFYVASGTYVVNKGYNNVVWNNQNNGTEVSISSSWIQYTGSIFNNNYLDASASGNWGTAWGTDNVKNLSKLNTGTNAPYFLKPPMNGVNNLIGANQTSGNADCKAISQADWRLSTNSSYLFAKGITTTILTDKAGKTFASPPTVGAYEKK